MKLCSNCDHNLVCNNKDNYIDCLLWSGWHTELPTEDGKYLVVKDLHYVVSGIYDYEVAVFTNGMRGFFNDGDYEYEEDRPGFINVDHNLNWYEVKDVIAWRKIPKFKFEEK